MSLPTHTQSPFALPLSSPLDGSQVACELAKFNISRDGHYAHNRRSRSDRGIHLRVNVKHATPALKLTTLPYTLTKQELRHFHRCAGQGGAGFGAGQGLV